MSVVSGRIGNVFGKWRRSCEFACVDAADCDIACAREFRCDITDQNEGRIAAEGAQSGEWAP